MSRNRGREARQQTGKRYDLNDDRARELGRIIMTCEGFTLATRATDGRYVAGLRYRGINFSAIGKTAIAACNVLIEQVRAKPVATKPGATLMKVFADDLPNDTDQRASGARNLLTNGSFVTSTTGFESAALPARRVPVEMTALYQQRWEAALARGDVYRHQFGTKRCIICQQPTEYTDGILHAPICGPVHFNDAQHQYGGNT